MPAPLPGRRCVCPGSFDPVTAGHLDVIARAATLFDEVIVAVLQNPAKPGLFDQAERVELIRAGLAQVGLAGAGSVGAGSVGAGSVAAGSAPRGSVRVEAVAGGLLVDYCRRVGAVAVVKGLRGGTDFAYELPMALMNRHLTDLETVFLAGDPKLEHVSSSLVKEVAAHGGDVSGLVPDVVLAALRQRLGGSSGESPAGPSGE